MVDLEDMASCTVSNCSLELSRRAGMDVLSVIVLVLPCPTNYD
jgi:hypothetical protein